MKGVTVVTALAFISIIMWITVYLDSNPKRVIVRGGSLCERDGTVNFATMVPGNNGDQFLLLSLKEDPSEFFWGRVSDGLTASPGEQVEIVYLPLASGTPHSIRDLRKR